MISDCAVWILQLVCREYLQITGLAIPHLTGVFLPDDKKKKHRMNILLLSYDSAAGKLRLPTRSPSAV